MKILILGDGDDPGEMLEFIMQALEEKQPDFTQIELKARRMDEAIDIVNPSKEPDYKSQPYKNRFWKKR